MKKKVIITGASGFVGQNLIPYLSKRGFEIVMINREELFNTPTLQSAIAVVHLAGKAHDLQNVANPSEYFDVNYGLTKNIFDSFLASDLKKFIFVSSVKAAADIVVGALTEEVNPDPKTDYGKSKLMAEKYIQNRSVPADKQYYILRPCMVHGPGNKGNLNLLYQFVQKGLPYPLAAFTNSRSFLSIENLCFVIHRLVMENIPSGIYNVADDVAMSTNQVVSVLAETMERKPRLWSIPRKTIMLLAKIGDFLKLPINSQRISKLTENYVVSNAKLKNALNHELPLTSLEGLTVTANSFKNK